jgi:hypothetical protein
VKVFPALLCLLLLGLGPARAADPDPPQTLPLIYEQPGPNFILRIDNRRYQVPNELKEAVARLMASANYPRTKLIYEEYKRALGEKAKADATLSKAEQQLQRAISRTERIRATMAALRNQLILARSTSQIEVRQVLMLQEQILHETSNLAAAEAQEDRERSRLEEARHANEPTMQRTEKAKDDYIRALGNYEKPFAEIRALAMTAGTAL